MKVSIVPFQDQYSKYFYELNYDWLSEYFYVEDYDEKVLKNCKEEILVLIKRLEKNKLLFETSKVAVIGKPNTGKSSLINFLTEEDVSIVNKQAGTTRDVVSKMFSLNGIPVTIFDTAGIRETSDSVEKEGKEKALNQAASENIIL